MRSPRTVSDLGEKGLIERMTRSIKTDRSVIKGIGDDCAVLAAPRGTQLLFACDMLVEGVHFRRGAAAAQIGWKALAVNVSDIAAMGGLARYAVVSLGLPNNVPVSFVDRLYKGLRRCADRYAVNLVGGDTNRSERVVIDAAILGEVEKDRVVYRSGARAGDHLLVTGRIGGAVRSGRHLTFQPRLREARILGNRKKLHAMIDLSDGLYPDLIRICEASGVAAELDAARIPRQSGCSLESALTEGEDFELLMAVSPADAEDLLGWAKRRLPCGLTRIGRIVPRRAAALLRIAAPRGMKVPRSLDGFQHFS